METNDSPSEVLLVVNYGSCLIIVLDIIVVKYGYRGICKKTFLASNLNITVNNTSESQIILSIKYQTIPPTWPMIITNQFPTTSYFN